MIQIKKTILTLVTLLAVTTGAWADDLSESFTTNTAPSGPTVDWNKTSKTGTFTMPGGNVELEPEYYPQATVAEGAVTAVTGAAAATDAELVTVDQTKLTGGTTLMFCVTETATAPAYTAEGWTTNVPNAKDYSGDAEKDYYVWYYLKGTDEGVGGATATFSDGDMNTTALTVTLAPAYTAEGYEVVIPAGEYATYYKDEALRVEDETIEIYTITAVEDSKAVLSEKLDASKANMPILVKNTSNEQKTVLLIPCNEPDLAITVADEFLGTLTAKEFTEDDMATGDFYVCNGKEFIKVRGAGTLAANRAYLKVTGNAPASIPFRRSIGGEGEGTTGIDNVNPNPNVNDNDAAWYDLGGRKLNGKPAQKGVYIKNGRKVIVP